jgi:hypothetical protein
MIEPPWQKPSKFKQVKRPLPEKKRIEVVVDPRKRSWMRTIEALVLTVASTSGSTENEREKYQKKERGAGRTRGWISIKRGAAKLTGGGGQTGREVCMKRSDLQ